MQGKKSKTKSQNQIQNSVDYFLKGSTQGKYGRYVIDGERLVYRMAITNSLYLNSAQIVRFLSKIEQGEIVCLSHTPKNLS